MLHKNQEFSWKSFPHVFKAIRLLEKKLEPKNDFFVLRKKVCFFCGVGFPIAKQEKTSCFYPFLKHRFDMGKTKILKNHVFTTYIFNYIWTFLVKIKSVCSMVILEFSVLYILPMLWTIKIHVLEPKFYKKSSFWSKKDIFLAQITIGNRFFCLYLL